MRKPYKVTLYEFCQKRPYYMHIFKNLYEDKNYKVLYIPDRRGHLLYFEVVYEKDEE